MEWCEPKQDWSEIDRRVGLPSDAQLRRLSARIDDEHARRSQRDDTSAWRSPDHRLIGLLGERHVARILEVAMDLTVRPYGNARKNLVMSDGTKVDVVTRSVLRSGQYPDLTRKIGSRGKPDILVLVVWHGFEIEPEVGGWTYESTLMQTGDVRRFREGIENRILPIGSLQPIWTLVGIHSPGHPLANESEWRAPWFEQAVQTDQPKPEAVQTSLF